MKKIAVLLIFSVLFSFVLSEFVKAPRTKQYQEADHIATLRFEKTTCEEFFRKNGLADGLRGGFSGDCLPIDHLGNDVDDIKFVGRCVNDEKNILVYIVDIQKRSGDHHESHKDIEAVSVHTSSSNNKNKKDEDEGEPQQKREEDDEMEGEPEPAKAQNGATQESNVTERKQARSFDKDDRHLSSSTQFYLRLFATERSYKYDVVDFHLKRKGGNSYQSRRPDCYINNDYCSESNTPLVTECVKNPPTHGHLRQGTKVYIEFTKRKSSPHTCKERKSSGLSCCRYVNTDKGICVPNVRHSPSSDDEKKDNKHESQESSPVFEEHHEEHHENSKTNDDQYVHSSASAYVPFNNDFDDFDKRYEDAPKQEDLTEVAPVAPESHTTSEFQGSHGKKKSSTLGKSIPSNGWVKLTPTNENKPTEQSANAETTKA